LLKGNYLGGIKRVSIPISLRIENEGILKAFGLGFPHLEKEVKLDLIHRGFRRKD